MKRFLVIAAALFAIALVAIAGYLAYVVLRYPDAGPVPSLTVQATPERLARGSYLANHVAVCIDCHSTRDWTKFSGPLVPGTEGKGGFLFDASLGFPGKIYAKNITPAGIGSLTDGELLYAIATGVGSKGRALFPVMPYRDFDNLSDEDLASIIAYIRTLKPIANDVPPTSLDFPLNFIVRTLPVPHTRHPAPDTANTIAYGKYLVTAAGCIDCHTVMVKGQPVKGMEFAGGFEFPFPDGTVRSANITPDDETGIGSWAQDIFIAKFKFYEHADSSGLSLAETGYNSAMPWTMYAGMTEHDIAAIYAYLRTVPPVKHDVTKFTPRNTAPGDEKR